MWTQAIFNISPAGYTRPAFIKQLAISDVRTENTCDFILDSDLLFDENLV